MDTHCQLAETQDPSGTVSGRGILGHPTPSPGWERRAGMHFPAPTPFLSGLSESHQDQACRPSSKGADLEPPTVSGQALVPHPETAWHGDRGH